MKKVILAQFWGLISPCPKVSKYCKLQCFCRSQRTLENRLTLDDDKITLLEQQVRSLKITLGDAERRYEEVIAQLFSSFYADSVHWSAPGLLVARCIAFLALHIGFFYFLQLFIDVDKNDCVLVFKFRAIVNRILHAMTIKLFFSQNV